MVEATNKSPESPPNAAAAGVNSHELPSPRRMDSALLPLRFGRGEGPVSHPLSPPWFGLLLVTMAYAIAAALTWRKWPDALVDYGIQLYLPWRISTGSVLYHDVMYMAGGPLSQYYHALLFKLFGVSLSTLIFSNLAIGLGVLILIYRRFLACSDVWTATTISLGVVLVFAFNQFSNIGNYNFITPYCHDVWHGVALSILAISLLSLWLESGQAQGRFEKGAGTARARSFEWFNNPARGRAVPAPSCAFLESALAQALTRILIAALLLVSLSLFAAKKPAKMAAPPKVPPGKPEIFRLEPRGVQRGVTARIKLIGTNLTGLTQLKLHNPKLKGQLLADPETTTNEAWIEITAASDLTRGAYEISVKNTNSESSKLKVYVDDLPQTYEAEQKKSKGPKPALKLPVSFWGTLDPPGDSDDVEFEARSGESVILDLAAKSIGSKANAMLTLFDEKGALLASNNGFDEGDPLLNFRIPASGRYRVRIGETTDGGSKDHFYRLSMGTFPVVVGCFPLGVPANQESDLELIGFNLPPGTKAHIKAGATGETQVPVDPEKFRARRTIKVVVNDGPELVETEPNDTPGQAMRIPIPCAINGRIWPQPDGDPSYPSHSSHSSHSSDPSDALIADADLFQFEAHVGQTLVIETDAARRGSPIDTKIEILHADGTPVERLLLQAVRDSHITFIAIDSNNDNLRVEHWQEMELNQFMYVQGEVCKIFRMPQGPDSGFQFYVSQGKRRDYFDSNPISHALDEPAYIVEPHPPGTKLAQNGLPIFTVYYANDDDGERKLGTDSRLLFTTPTDGSYLVRVTDTRGHAGQRFAYRLIVREAKPDFKVTLGGANPAINAGGGKEFSVNVDRMDGFDEDVTVNISDLPPGFGALTPIVIQAGHLEAKGTINAALDAPAPNDTNANMTKVTATAMVGGHTVTNDVNNLGKIKLEPKPKLFVALEPYDEQATNYVERSVRDKPLEITIAPGQSIPAWLKIKRNGHDDLVTFSVESLPHGVIVDNIGLNGVLIPKGKDERQIFLTAAKWVPEVDRLCFAKANQADNQTSLPVLIHVRKAAVQASSQ